MKKILLSLAVFFLSLSVFSVSLKDFSLSVEPFFGIKQGQLDEYVYEKDSSGNLQKESELNWPIKNMFQLGGNIEGGYKNLKGKLHFSALIPGSSGTMEDSDWFGLTSMKTTYSKSENSITQGYDFSALLKYDFQPIKSLKIAPFFEYEYKTISFEARNGYGWYGHLVTPYVSWDDEKAVYFEKGELCGIDYRRDVTQFFLGFSVEYASIEKIKMTGSFSISPYAYTVSYDTHYASTEASTNDYADEIEFIFNRLKFSAGCYYVLNECWEIGLNFGGFYAFETLGTNYYKKHTSSAYTNVTKASGTKSGAGAWEINATISCRFKIF